MNKFSAFGLNKLFSSASPKFQHISQSEAALIMASGKEHVVLDVRTVSEFAEGHIPGAVNIPNQLIGSAPLSQLPDKNQLILVHCLSGGRSRVAAGKLADMGYTNVKDFGGINTWNGEIVRS